MRVLLIYFFLFILFTSCTKLFFPTHFGKVRLIKEKDFNKADSFLVLPYAYTYYFQSNVFISRPPFAVVYSESDTSGTTAPTPESIGYLKNNEMMNYEKIWSDVLKSKLANHFKTTIPIKREPTGPYGKYKFKYIRYRFSPLTNFVMGEYNDVQMTHIAWLIKNGYSDSAKKKIPFDLLQLSYENPIIIIANFSYFHETEFQANYSTGSTGLRFSALAMITIVKNGEFVYYRNAQTDKGYKNDKYVAKVLSRLTEHLFDKLE